MTLRTQLAYLSAAITLVFGLIALVSPLLVAGLLGLQVVSPRGVSELRSSYGALTLAMGVLMLWAIPMRPQKGRLLRTLAILLAAAALGRLASIAVDVVVSLTNLLFLLLQVFVAGTIFWASNEKQPSRAEQRARREAAEARDEAASARVQALAAERRSHGARSAVGGGQRETDRS